MYQDNQWKYFAILNRNLPIGQGMNILAHGVNALGEKLRSDPNVCFANYKNADGRELGNFSVWPYIVLESSTSEKLRNVRLQLAEANIPSVEFISSMLGSSNEEQLENTRNIREGQGEVFGLFTFGPTEVLQPLMKRFSLFRGFRGESNKGESSIPPPQPQTVIQQNAK